MFPFLCFIIFSFLLFSLALVGYKNFRSTTFYALAIGGAVNANFFHANAYPIDCFGLPFGIDSVIYTLFAFCVVVILLKENERSAYLLAFSSIIAILFSASMQLIADLLSNGSSKAAWTTFGEFCISAVASVIAIVATVEILKRLKGKCNDYVFLSLGILSINLLNSGLYYPFSILLGSLTENMWLYLATSCLGEMIALLSGLTTLYFINLYERKIKK